MGGWRKLSSQMQWGLASHGQIFSADLEATVSYLRLQVPPWNSPLSFSSHACSASVSICSTPGQPEHSAWHTALKKEILECVNEHPWCIQDPPMNKNPLSVLWLNLFLPQFSYLYNGGCYNSLHDFLICFPGVTDGKASAYNVGDPDSIPGSERSPGEGNGNPLQYSCLKNSMDGGAW